MNITIKEVTDTRNSTSNGTLVKCPKCGCDSTHLKGIVSFGDYDNRREAVELQFECESGDAFSVFYRQHKGETHTEIASNA
ncbi:MAG: hypothetical protein ACYDCM_11115 [Candidatus Acidiferrales bacterium]